MLATFPRRVTTNLNKNSLLSTETSRATKNPTIWKENTTQLTRIKDKHSNTTKLTKKHAAKSATTATSHRYYLSRSPCTKMAMDCGTLELHDASEGVRENFRGMGRMCYLKRRTPTTFVCVCDNSVFYCLFVSDGRCLMVIESILMKPSQVFLLIFSPQYVEWFFQC